MNPFRSIRSQLVAIFILVIVLPTALTARVGMLVFLKTMEAERNRLSTENSSQASQIIIRHIQLAEEIGRHLANIPGVNQFTPQKLTLLLENCTDIWPLAEILIYNKNRSLLARSPKSTGNPEQHGEQNKDILLTQALNLEIVSDIFSVPNGLAIHSAVPVVDMSTLEAVGVVLISIPIHPPLLQTIRIATHSHVSIKWDASKQMITTLADVQAEPLLNHLASLYDVINAPMRHRLESIQGQSYTVSYTPLMNKRGQKLGVLSTALDLKGLNATQKNGLMLLAIVTSLALLTAIAVALFTSSVFTKPLLRLSKAIQSVALGNLETRTQEERNDEFGILAASFNSMAQNLEDKQRQILEYSQRLKESNDELARFNRELEDRVRQRTSDLQQSNEELKEEIRKKQMTELMLNQARSHAEEANKAKSAFLASMSHEIRTPLNVVVGMSDYMLGGKQDPEQRDYLELIKLSADHLLLIIDDILDFSKIEVGKMEIEPCACNLPKLLDSCLLFVRDTAKRKGLELLLETNGELPEFILADPVRLKQILLNLLTNAIKFTDKGRIVLHAEMLSNAPPDLPGNGDGSICLQFSVEDTGVGIHEECLKKIFQSFTQVDDSTTRRAGGVGLGLAIVKGLAERMRGVVQATSIAGQGSVFTFLCCFPLAEAKQTDQDTNVPLQSSPGINRGHILIVEDNPLSARTASLLISRLGHSSKTASNGKEALHLLAKEHFDLVFMDLEMPEMDGMETTRLIRQEGDGFTKVLNPEVPIIAMTAHALVEIKQQCLEAGMNGFLTKPVILAALNRTLNTFFKSVDNALAAYSLSPESPTLDTNAALKIIEDPSILKEVTSLFHKGLPQIQQDVQSAVRGKDIQALRKTTHKLKSDAETIGATKVGELSREIQQKIKSEYPDSALALAQALLVELETLSRVLDERLQERPA